MRRFPRLSDYSQDDQISQLYDAADGFWKINQAEKAIEKCRHILDVQPTDEITLDLLAIVTDETNNQSYLKSAIIYYEKALSLGLVPSISFCYWFATLYRSAGRPSDSRIWFEEAVKSKPLSDVDLVYQGIAYAEQRNYEQAVLCYQKAIKSNPEKFKPIYANLANAYKKLGKFKEALKTIQKAITSDPGEINHYKDLGIIYEKLNEPDKAIQTYERLLLLTPEEFSQRICDDTLNVHFSIYDKAIRFAQRRLRRIRKL